MLNLTTSNSRPKVQRNDLTIYDRVESWWDVDDQFFGPLRRLVHARMAYISNRIPIYGRRVLDAGCGGGYMSEALARSGAKVTGVDIAPGAIDAARLRAKQEGLPINYRIANAEQLPFDNGSFDAVVCTDVLVHVPNPQQVIAELTRVVRPGGEIMFSAINRNWLARLVMVTLGEDLLGWVPQGTHDPKKFLTPRQLSRWLAENKSPVLDLQGLGPIGWSNGLVFGSHPTRTVMYQGHARRAVTTFGS